MGDESTSLTSSGNRLRLQLPRGVLPARSTGACVPTSATSDSSSMRFCLRKIRRKVDPAMWFQSDRAMGHACG